MGEPIPGPRGLPVVGNMFDIWQDRDLPLRGLERLSEVYGPIYQATLGGRRRIVCSSAALLEELTNEKNFVKIPPAQVSSGTRPKGLFTARNEDPDWAQGHRILMPAFAPLSVLDMFDDMKDIAHQLIISWARKGPEYRILATEDFTKLTLDTIALCTMGYRFNSFYSDQNHPFVEAMTFVFTENTARTTRPKFVSKLMPGTQAEFEKCQNVMREVGQKIIDQRRANPTDKKDVLNAMIYGKDPKTGEVMRDELIMEQMITFLIAGHETTSGLLSFAIMHLLKNPQAYLKAQREVDEVIGDRAIKSADISKLKYLNAVLRETARLSPTVPVLQKEAAKRPGGQPATLGNGRYSLLPDDQIIALMSKAQRDPEVWGNSADDFEPERMLDENFDKISAQYPGAWKPFGNGKRACIGRPFAWQESMLVLAMVLQNFDVKFDNPAYKPTIKQALTVKPAELYIRVTPRRGMDATSMDRSLHSAVTTNGTTSASSKSQAADSQLTGDAAGSPMVILYGSNTGTCQAFAARLASEAAARGFSATIRDMDSATAAVPKNVPLVIITSSYEGQPPDNAARFVEWLETADANSMTGVTYTVFGCGHKDWVQTFHRVPKLTDELMTKLGAVSMAPSGFADAAKGTLYSDFEEWLDGKLWPSIASQGKASEHVETATVEISTSARASSLRYDVGLATVSENRVLTQEGEPVKCHMEIELPSSTTYECGDYLAVLPLNSEKGVRQILSHFGLPWDATVTLKTAGPSTIPTNTPLSVFDVLRSYVELSQPATKKNLRILATYTQSIEDRATLMSLADDGASFDKEVTSKRASVFDFLGRFPSVDIPFGDFLCMLPPLQVRQYSISSSPLHKAGFCTISYGVISREALANPDHQFEGVTGSYLRSLRPGDSIQVSVRATAKKTFRLPPDAGNTPLLMFAAGTGLAPFRGFLQERALQMQSNPDRKLARAVLFLGCRSQTKDRIYADELDAWVAQGVVDVNYAFSAEKEASHGCAHVPDRMIREADDLVQLWKSDARAYICGTRAFATGIADAAKTIAARARDSNTSDAETRSLLESRFREAIQARVASDVFD